MALLLPYTATYGPRLYNMSPLFLCLVDNFERLSISLVEAADYLFLGAAYKCSYSVFLTQFFIFWGEFWALL